MEENKPIDVNEEWFLSLIREEVTVNQEWFLNMINEEASEPNEALKKAVDTYKRIIMNSEKKEETQ